MLLNKFYNQHKSVIILTLILIVGFFLVTNALIDRGSLWSDELFNLVVIDPELNFGQIYENLLAENSPPVFYLLLHFWLKVFPPTLISLRLIPVIFYFLSIVAIYFLGKEIFSKRVGFLAGFLTAVSTFITFYATEARMYTLVFFLAILSVYFFWRYYQKERLIDLIFYFISTLLLVGSHLQGLFVVLAQDAFIFFDYFVLKPKKPNVIFKFFISQLIVGLLFLIWFIPFLISKLYSAGSGWYFHMNYNGIHFFSTLLEDFLIFGSAIGSMELGNLFIRLLIFSLLLLPIISFSTDAKSRKVILSFKAGKEEIFVFIIFLIPLFISYYFYAMLGFYQSKYFIVIIVPFFLLLAKGLESLRQYSSKMFLLIAFLLIFFVGMSNIYAFDIGLLRSNWDKLAHEIEIREKSGDKIISQNFLRTIPLKKYYHGNLPIEGFYPIENNKTEHIKIITDNWKNIIDENNVVRLKESTQDYERIFFLYDAVTDWRQLALKWFFKNGWYLVYENHFYSSGIFTPSLYLFSKTSPDN